ncbi:S26 family signal peptidase [Oceaniovalibus sp. ACAM 378]|uniref:S26 family signal peptidase n=1 Tax=Oceaniovalibus sp. ACAM 378 TaxID=2599923 RepID=UPI0011D395F9|nr:S26 family signal peptidase [Oceaniovalibus sp. ACAM 378]TYB86090.1 S26 family signal peptidase [Oceaniovalibus sp. ACAM 378]
MKRRTWSRVGAVAIAAIAIPAFVELPTAIIWNASPSAPIGFYQVRSADGLEIPDLVVVDAPEPLERFAVERGYLPPDILLLKRVVGLPGQTVCRINRTITVDGIAMGDALEQDTFGRLMPVWHGCRRIARDEVFLMNRDARNSLDGRYFGPIPASSIIGTAVPVWTIEPGTGRYRWRTGTD